MHLLKWILILSVLWPLSMPVWGQEESIAYDSTTQSYIYHYRGYDIYEDGRKVDLGIIQGIFTPAKIIPEVTSFFRLNKEWAINYRYSLSNEETAKQPINQFTFKGIPTSLISGNNELDVSNPVGWEGNFYGGLVRWMAKESIEKEGIQPDTSASGFGYASFDLPGIVQAELSGDGTSTGFNDSNSGPDETSPLREQDELIHYEDYKPFPVAAPMVVVPKPFDAAVVIDHIRAQVATWPNFKTGGYNGNVPSDKKIFLLDASFAAQLDRYLAAAADSFRHNQPKAAKEEIEKLRNMLMREHHNLDQESEVADEHDLDRYSRHPLIDRLAARVLDFDLKYVHKRMEVEKERD